MLTRRFEAESPAGELNLLDPPCGLASPIRAGSSSGGEYCSDNEVLDDRTGTRAVLIDSRAMRPSFMLLPQEVIWMVTRIRFPGNGSFLVAKCRFDD